MGCAPVQHLSVLEYVQTFDHHPLRPYLFCQCGDDLKIVEVGRKNPNNPKFREVKISGKIDTVSITDGFRVMYAFEKANYYFANVKVESFDPNKYKSDKIKLISMLQGFSNDAKIKMNYLDKSIRNGFEVYGSEKSVMDVGGIIGSYNVFSDSDNVVVTMDILNQGKENRRFNSLQEYFAIRDKFIEKYTECMKNKKSPIFK